MPFVHVRALPLPGDFDAAAAVRAISAEFAAATGTDERHVTVTWERIAPGHYAHAGATAASQPAETHPVLVEVLAPDLHPPDRIEAMLEAAASAVAAQARVPPSNVFAEFRAARAGAVFDGGEIARW